MPPSDFLQAQLRAFFQGDRTSLDSIASRCGLDLDRMVRAAIRRYHMRESPARFDPQEITQTVYLALLRVHRDRDAPPVDNGIAYLHSLIHNAIRGSQRRGSAHRRRDDLMRFYDPRSVPTVVVPAAQEEQAERQDLLRVALRRLTHEERVLVLCRAHGWSFPEIARRLRLTDNMCRSAHRRVIQRLRQEFDRAPSWAHQRPEPLRPPTERLGRPTWWLGRSDPPAPDRRTPVTSATSVRQEGASGR